MKEKIKKVLDNLPNKPGIYMHLDAKGRLLYVGKAKDLKKRVTSYFSGDKDPKTTLLVEKIADVSTIVTNSEAEALLLEDSLIKKHKPPYNIDLRDDKRYPYFRLDINEEYPQLTIVRQRKKDGAKYFGPYANSIGDVKRTIDQLFKLRKCAGCLKPKQKPCLYQQLGQCLCPCVGDVREEYAREVQKVVSFLQGDYVVVSEKLEQEMKALAKDLKYEQAGILKEKIAKLQKISGRQSIVSPDLLSRDIWHFAGNEVWQVAEVLLMENGRITSEQNFSAKTKLDPEENFRERLILSFYNSREVLPNELIVPPQIISASGKSWLTEHQIKVFEPQSGFRNDLLLLARKNVLKLIQDKMVFGLPDTTPAKGLKRLQEIFELDSLPVRIDCFDISHIQGSETVASMTVLRNGIPDKASYRKYIIDLTEPNDFAAMEEVLSRRYLKVATGEQERPEMILIDGGKGQLSIAVQVLNKFELDIPLAALAKKNEEVFIPGQKNPILLKRSDPGLRLLQTLRDEAHRFAVSFHRQRRSKRIINPSPKSPSLR